MWSRWFLRPVVAAVLAAVASSGTAAAAPCWPPPVAAPVADPFRPPPCAWCPGNRGIEYATGAGAVVTAVATGRVTFAARVAGTSYVVVAHADGLRATYANVVATHLRVGDLVVVGTRVGVTAGRFHFGLRDGVDYVDPTPMIGRWVGRPRLIPLDGDHGPPGRARMLHCGP
ncbi:MAG TPA: M23 family metallopeptidase [Ilumatobacter sp.]